MPVVLDASRPDFAASFEAVVEGRREAETDVRGDVDRILADVRTRGDAALLEWTERFDGPVGPGESLRVDAATISKAKEACSAEAINSLARAADRIRAFHARKLPAGLSYTDDLGVGLGFRWGAIDAAGLYVPGGTAAYPSSVLMNAIPAQVAGCRRLAMAVPAPGGHLNSLVLAAADLLGIDEIYRIGGAQAIGALAYGTASISPVDKIVGPGNAYVAEAKRQVFGRVGIDMIAGPSEICVVADASVPAAWIAADLLSQAEHDTAAQSILITDDRAHADAVVHEVERQLPDLDRREIATASWQRHGAVIVVETLQDAVALVDRLAPEHLEVACAGEDELVEAIRHAGSIFVGAYTPEVIGDYVGGPNHVLPTARSARFSSGLSVFDFLKRTTVLRCSKDAFRELAPAAEILARLEGLDGHARALTVRGSGDA